MVKTTGVQPHQASLLQLVLVLGTRPDFSALAWRGPSATRCVWSLDQLLRGVNWGQQPHRSDPETSVRGPGDSSGLFIRTFGLF